MITSYSEYLEKPSVLTFEDMTRIHAAIIAGIGEDEEAEAVYDKLVRAGTNYIDTRAGWKLMPKPVRKERNDERTARHNAVIIALDELAECVGGVPGGNGTAGVSGSVWDSEGSPEEGMVLTACLNRFLQATKAEDRKIFVQRYWYMYSVKEIAGNLGLGESKVKMTLLRQREKLKKVLEEEGIPV